MKIRTGFVSNSSSSSFILALPRAPTSSEELQKMLFPVSRRFVFPYPYGKEEPKSWSDKEMSKALWGIIGSPLSLIIVRKMIKAESSVREADYFVKKNAKAVFYEFEVGDSHGDIDGELGCTMENGDVFSAVPNFKINHH